MSIMASWREKQWEVSSSKIAVLDNLSTSLALDSETNKDNEGQPASYDIKYKLQTFSFDTTYSAMVGNDPLEEKESWYELVGESGPLYINNSQFGPDKIKLLSVSVSETIFDSKGRMISIKLAFSFEEDAEEKSASKDSKQSAAPASAPANEPATATGSKKIDKTNWQKAMAGEV